jgi:hypothetical protein
MVLKIVESVSTSRKLVGAIFRFKDHLELATMFAFIAFSKHFWQAT